MAIDTSLVISLFLTGISRGMVYFLLATGLTLVFGVVNVVNFAHGTFYMLGVYLCFTVVGWLNFGSAFVIVPLALTLLGGLAEFGLFRRIYKAEHVQQLLLSLGIIYILGDCVKLIWGTTPKSIAVPNIFRGCLRLGDIVVTNYSLFITMVSGLIAVVTLLILYRTKLGSIVRACTFDSEMANTAGINVPRVFLWVFAAGTGLAGLASVTAAPIGAGVLGIDFQIIVIAFAVVIIGGIGSVEGVLVAAIIVGVVEALGILVLPKFSEIFIYLIVIVILIVRPAGLFGKP